MSKKNPTAEIFEATNAEYHARTDEVSHSMLDVFRDNPEAFYALYIGKTLERPKPTPAMEFGSLVHSWILERDTCVVIPNDVLSSSGTRAGSKFKEFRDENPGKILLKEEETELLRKIEAAIASHEMACKIIFESEGINELNIRWKDRATGLWCRCRIDRPHTKLTGDLKTSASAQAQAFAKSAVYYGYHRQAAWYQDGRVELEGGKRLPFVFVVVTKTLPIQVVCYEMDDGFIELGRKENQSGLVALDRCHQTGNWKPPGWGEILVLKEPNWARNENQWEVE